MRRAQFDKPVTFILALVIVSLVLYVGYIGINYLFQLQEDRELRLFWNNLDRQVSRNLNYGAVDTLMINLPRSDGICFFNIILPVDNKTCEIYDYYEYYTHGGDLEDYRIDPEEIRAGNETCASPGMVGYWRAASNVTEAEASNIILSSGIAHRNPRIQPANDLYQCFSGSSIRVRIEGHGGYATISPAS
ncbi:MAG: hypothetical protein ACMXYL_05655 [Candidatus Woesearchaeota archaeon]